MEFVFFVWISEQTSQLSFRKILNFGFYNPDEKCLQRGTDSVFK